MGVDIGDLSLKQPIELAQLKGKSVAIDGNNALYQFLAIIRQPDGTPLMDAKGRVTSHLTGLFYRTARLVEAGIKPAYVFDGPPPKMKKRELAERREIREEAKEKWEKALKEGAVEEARSYAMASSRLTGEMIAEAKLLLGAMGIPVVQAPSEGEAQAAAMASRGDVFAAASQDYDALLFGAPRLVRNLTLSGRRKLPRRNQFVEVTPELIELDALLKLHEITREKLVWVGILVGNDFDKGVKGIGPKKALKLVKECSSLGEVVEKSGGQFEIEPEEVEKFFLNPPAAEVELKWEKPDAAGVVKVLVDEHQFSRERVENALKPYLEALGEAKSQSSLSGWFE